jgi:hypothetical protein
MEVSGTKVEVDYGAPLKVLVNGKQVALTAAGLDLRGGGRVTSDNTGEVTVSWPDRSRAELNTLNPDGINAINLYFSPAQPTKVAGLTTALVADTDGMLTLTGGNGQRFEIDPETTAGFHAFYGRFASSWRITQAQSLFSCPPGKSTHFYTVAGFPSQSSPSPRSPPRRKPRPRRPVAPPASSTPRCSPTACSTWQRLASAGSGRPRPAHRASSSTASRHKLPPPRRL